MGLLAILGVALLTNGWRVAFGGTGPSNAVRAGYVTIASDAGKLVVRSAGEPAHAELVFVDLESGLPVDRRQVTNRTRTPLGVSRDGGTVAYFDSCDSCRDDVFTELHVWRPGRESDQVFTSLRAGPDLTVLATVEPSPAVSPDGSKVAFIADTFRAVGPEGEWRHVIAILDVTQKLVTVQSDRPAGSPDSPPWGWQLVWGEDSRTLFLLAADVLGEPLQTLRRENNGGGAATLARPSIRLFRQSLGDTQWTQVGEVGEVSASTQLQLQDGGLLLFRTSTERLGKPAWEFSTLNLMEVGSREQGKQGATSITRRAAPAVPEAEYGPAQLLALGRSKTYVVYDKSGLVILKGPGLNQ